MQRPRSSRFRSTFAVTANPFELHRRILPIAILRFWPSWCSHRPCSAVIMGAKLARKTTAEPCSHIGFSMRQLAQSAGMDALMRHMITSGESLDVSPREKTPRARACVFKWSRPGRRPRARSRVRRTALNRRFFLEIAAIAEDRGPRQHLPAAAIAHQAVPLVDTAFDVECIPLFRVSDVI